MLIGDKHDAYTDRCQIGWKWVLLVPRLKRNTMATGNTNFAVTIELQPLFEIPERLIEERRVQVERHFLSIHSLAVLLFALEISYSLNANKCLGLQGMGISIAFVCCLVVTQDTS